MASLSGDGTAVLQAGRPSHRRKSQRPRECALLSSKGIRGHSDRGPVRSARDVRCRRRVVRIAACSVWPSSIARAWGPRK